MWTAALDGTICKMKSTKKNTNGAKNKYQLKRPGGGALQLGEAMV